MFDFKAAGKEFVKEINKGRDDFFEIDIKSIQLRWTDIEIRKYRLHQEEEKEAINEDGLEGKKFREDI